MKVLIVDDTRTDRRIVSAYVEQLGHQVVAAGDGEEALEQFRREQPDLVLLDVMMPGVDGYEVARRIRAAAPDDWVPIVFLSAMVDDEHLARGIESGGDDYITKPPRPMVLEAKLKAMERIARMRQTLLSISAQLEVANLELTRLSREDPLTGVANRRAFDRCLADEWQRARRDRSPLALILADIDHFKAYNDTYGHQAGDECLRRVGAVLKEALLRSGDLAARYGGEEFALVLPGATLPEVGTVAERIRSAVEARAIPHGASATAGCVTVTLGVASARPADGGSAEELVAAADRALYGAKQAGRNRLGWAAPEPG